MTEEIVPLSDRECEVLQLVATGATNQQIARDLVISPNTVKVHLRNIFEKLGVQSRTEATTEAIRRGLVSVGETAIPGPSVPVSPGATIAEEAASPPAPAIDWLPERTVQRPVRPWQRVYTVVALLLVLLATLAPAWWQARTRAAPASLFSDAGRGQSSAPQRVEAARWSAGAALPQGRSRLALAAKAPLLYAIGGETTSGISAALTVYDPRENVWRSGPDKPTAVANVSAGIIGDLVFVPGGLSSAGVTAVLEAYNTVTERWETRAALPTPLSAYGLAVSRGELYVFGGWDGIAYRADTFIYNPGLDEWRAGPTLPAPRAFVAGASLNDTVYAVGGYDGRRSLDEVWSYRPAPEASAAAWTQRAPLEAPRAGLGLTTVGTRLYAVGGNVDGPLDYSQQYDTQLDAWSRFGTPITASWSNLGVAALEQKVYAVGGWSNGYLSVNEQYQALLRMLLPIGGRTG